MIKGNGASTRVARDVHAEEFREVTQILYFEYGDQSGFE
jgi:hypothetical protein